MTEHFSELTHDELTRTTGGFLPLLGLIGMGSGLIGQILNGVAKKKTSETEQLLAKSQGAPGGAQGLQSPQAAPEQMQQV